MKTFSRLRQYLTELFLDWEMFQTKVVEKIKTHFMTSKFFS
jgi:glutathionyl-hydroquinone reductase